MADFVPDSFGGLRAYLTWVPILCSQQISGGMRASDWAPTWQLMFVSAIDPFQGGLQASAAGVEIASVVQARPFDLRQGGQACLSQDLGHPSPTHFGHRAVTDIGNHRSAEQQHSEAQPKKLAPIPTHRTPPWFGPAC